MAVLPVKRLRVFKYVHEGKNKYRGQPEIYQGRGVRAVRVFWNKGSFINISATAH